MNRLYLVRHGENLANLTKQFSHRVVDFSLTPKGVLQARQTAEFFKDRQIHAVYSSPLKRAKETAEIIAGELGLPVTIIEGFREVNVGTLEVQPPNAAAWDLHNQIVQKWLHDMPETQFPGGEDHFSLWGRMKAAIFQTLAGRTGQNVIIVGHGGLFICTIKSLCPQIDIDRVFSQTNHNCSVTEVLVHPDDGQLNGELVNWASSGHLHGTAAEFTPMIPTFTEEPAAGESEPA